MDVNTLRKKYASPHPDSDSIYPFDPEQFLGMFDSTRSVDLPQDLDELCAPRDLDDDKISRLDDHEGRSGCRGLNYD